MIRIQIITRYLSGEGSYKSLAKEIGTNETVVLRWVKKYQAFGDNAFDTSKTNTSYTKEFKMRVVTDYLNGTGSFNELMLKYNIPSDSTILKWVKDYNSHIELKNYIPGGEDIYMTKSRKVSKEERVNLLGKDDIQTQDVDIPNTLKVLKSFDIANSELFKKGYFTIQDAAATLTGIVLGANENENILDLCSAPGGKTTHIAELMNNTGSIIACDIYENRLKLVLATAKRLGAINIKTRQNDATYLNNDYVDKFDRVLADVPCSGIGVIRRKIDIKYQKDIESLSKISDLQYQILENASKYVKKNGVLVYSTCTIFKKENEDNVEKFLKNNPNFELVDISNMVEKNVADGKYIKTLPHIQNFDGFFIAKMVRKE